MPIGTALADISLMLGRGAAVGTSDVGLLLGLGLDLLLFGFIAQFGFLEGDAAHDGHGHLFIAYVTINHRERD